VKVALNASTLGSNWHEDSASEKAPNSPNDTRKRYLKG
jgi:hypothetical protein